MRKLVIEEETVDDAEGTADDVPQKPSRKKIWIALAVFLIFLLAGGVFLFFYVKRTMPEIVTSSADTAQSRVEFSPVRQKEVFITRIPPIRVQLNGKENLLVSLSFSSFKDMQPVVNDNLPRINDVIIRYFLRKNVYDIFSPYAKVTNKMELASRLNAILGESVIIQVFYEDLRIVSGGS